MMLITVGLRKSNGKKFNKDLPNILKTKNTLMHKSKHVIKLILIWPHAKLSHTTCVLCTLTTQY